MDRFSFAWPGQGLDASAGAVLPSRRAAIRALRVGLETQAGPVLLTGVSGVGKTWLCGRIRHELPADWRWSRVDLTPGVTAEGLYRLVLRGLHAETPPPSDVASARAWLEDVLVDEAAEAVRRVLVVDEAQNGTADVLEELRVLSNRLGEAGAFTGLILVGNPGLNRRLAGRALAPLASRLARRVVLPALELEEFTTFLQRVDPSAARNPELAERLHRSVDGIPGLAVRALSAWKTSATASLVQEKAAEPATSDRPRTLRADPPASPMLPGRPPLIVSDGMVEVGWNSLPDGDELAEDAEEPDDEDAPEPRPQSLARAADEPVNDPYAALQAWGERNRGDSAALQDADADELWDEETDGDEATPTIPPGARVEGHQEFAPYSQLFSRLRPTHETT